MNHVEEGSSPTRLIRYPNLLRFRKQLQLKICFCEKHPNYREKKKINQIYRSWACKPPRWSWTSCHWRGHASARRPWSGQSCPDPQPWTKKPRWGPLEAGRRKELRIHPGGHLRNLPEEELILDIPVGAEQCLDIPVGEGCFLDILHPVGEGHLLGILIQGNLQHHLQGSRHLHCQGNHRLKLDSRPRKRDLRIY